MVNRVVSGAHYGWRDWLMQRFTAAFMALYSVFILGYLWRQAPLDFMRWQALFQPQWMRLATLLFLLSLMLHAWVGVRNIFMDYVRHTLVRLLLHGVAILLLVAYAAWAVQILWSV